MLAKILSVLPSAFLYFIIFSTSLFFYGLASATYKRRLVVGGKIKRGAFFICAILPPCLLAAFRADSVGVDTKAMVGQIQLALSAHSIWEAPQVLRVGPEYAYVWMTYIVSRITKAPWVFLFLLQFLTMLPITLAAIQMRGKASIPLTMAVYLFCFYNNSLNLTRQSIACAFIMLAVTYLLNNDGKLNKKAVIAYALGLFNHKYAFIGVLATYGLVRVTKSYIRTAVKYLIYGAIMALPLILIRGYEWLNAAGAFETNSILGTHTNDFAEIFLTGRTNQSFWFTDPFYIWRIIEMLFRGMFIFVPYLFTNYMNNTQGIRANLALKSYRIISMCGLLIYAVTLYTYRTTYGGRISQFFDMFIILLMPYSATGDNKKLKKCLVAVLVICYWFLYIMVYGWSGSSFYALRT